MEISYLGHSSFRLKGKNADLITDPFDDSSLGFKFPKMSAQIVTVSHSHPDHNAVGLVTGNPFIIDGPGEYEIKEISVFGLPSFHDAKNGAERGTNTIYLVEMEGLRLCHLGDLGGTLSDKQIGEIAGVDVLMIPVGGVFTIGPKEATELIARIEPAVILPMHFRTSEMVKEMSKLASPDDFLRQFGVGNPTPLPKLTISKDKIPEERQVVILERKS